MAHFAKKNSFFPLFSSVMSRKKQEKNFFFRNPYVSTSHYAYKLITQNLSQIDWIDFPQSCTPTWKTRFWEEGAESLKTGWIIVLINRPWEPLGPAAKKLSWFRTNPFRKVFFTCFRLEISNKKNQFFENDTQVYPLN